MPAVVLMRGGPLASPGGEAGEEAAGSDEGDSGDAGLSGESRRSELALLAAESILTATRDGEVRAGGW